MRIQPLDTRQYEQARAASRIHSVAFRNGGGYKRLLAQIEDAREKGQLLPDSTQKSPASQMWGAYHDDKLIAVIVAIDYQMRYEGQIINMNGIGGVATLPEFRRKGAIRKIMLEIFKACRLKDQVFSYLYPFSFGYYHQFGYDFGCHRIQTKIPFKELENFPRKGAARQASQDDLPAIKKIYEAFTATTNGAMIREGERWENILAADPYIEQRFVYIWSDQTGKDRAYFSYVKKRDSSYPQEGESVFAVQDWACGDIDALRGMLGFITHFSSQFNTLEIRMPLHIPLETLFPEIDPIERILETAGQVRLLNVKKGLQLLNLPSWLPAFSCSLAVNDKFLPENTGVYQLTLDRNGNQVIFTPHESDVPADADLHIGVEALASLLLGSRGLAELLTVSAARLQPDLAAERRELICAFFREKQACIYDYF